MDKEEIVREVLDMPEGIETDSDAVCTVFFGEDAKEMSEPIDIDKLLNAASKTTLEDVQSVKKSLRQKSFDHSTQSKNEINSTTINTGTLESRIQAMPYDPECFANFLEIDPIHSACVDRKVKATVGRKYLIKPKYPVIKDPEDAEGYTTSITPDQFQADKDKINKFILNCNADEDFEEVLKSVAMDREAIGWAAFEVIREASGRIARLQRLPAVRLRVLDGFSGFVEFRGYDIENKVNLYTYYQRFGEKVGKKEDDPFDFSKNPKQVFRPYCPEEDGELQIGNGLEWNFVSKVDGEPLGKVRGNFSEAANEVLYLPNTHCNSVYYGYANIVPAISAILGNVYIRDYLMQFFEHNCVPRWAVIIKGAKVDDAFKKLISDYFKTTVKGASHQTMILTLSGMGLKNIEIEFKKLDADHKEADFIETKAMHNQEILVAEGVPASMIGLPENGGQSGRGLSNAEIFKDFYVTVVQKYYERRINKLFRLGLGVLNAVIQFQEFDTRDSLTIAQILQILLVQGAITINEARDVLGMGAIPGGDTAYVKIKEGTAIKVSDLPNIQSIISQAIDSNGNAQDVDITPEIGENVENNLRDSEVANQTSIN